MANDNKQGSGNLISSVNDVHEDTPSVKSPDIVDLINCAKFEAVFEVPGREGIHTVKVSLLWEGEYRDIVINSAKVTHPLDNEGRSIIIKDESIIYSIDSIDNVSYCDREDPANHKLLKNKLRSYISTFDPSVVQAIQNRITLLTNHRNMWFVEKDKELFEEFKKKMGTIQPL